MTTINQKKYIVKSPFTPIEVIINNNTFEISSFSNSRGRQTGKSMYCINRSNEKHKMTFQTCQWFKLFCIGMVIFGLIVLLLPVILGRVHWDGIGAMMLCGFLFSLSGAFILFRKGKKMVFDLQKNEMKLTTTPTSKAMSLTLNSIIGFQMIESYENVSSSLNEYTIGKRKYYELNIVFDNTRRMNLIKMTSHEAAINITKSLVEFIQKPLWWVEINRT